MAFATKTKCERKTQIEYWAHTYTVSTPGCYYSKSLIGALVFPTLSSIFLFLLLLPFSISSSFSSSSCSLSSFFACPFPTRLFVFLFLIVSSLFSCCSCSRPLLKDVQWTMGKTKGKGEPAGRLMTPIKIEYWKSLVEFVMFFASQRLRMIDVYIYRMFFETNID